MKLRHPDLPDDQVIEIPDDEDTAAVHEEAGWVRVPDPVQANPALAPGEPETKPATKAKTGTKTDKTDQDEADT